MEVMYVKVVLWFLGIRAHVCGLLWFGLSVLNNVFRTNVCRSEELKRLLPMIRALESLSLILLVNQLRSIGLGVLEK